MLLAGVPLWGDRTGGAFGGLGPPGGSRTTGREGSIKPPVREMIEPAGDTKESRPISRAMEDLLLIAATLGE